MAAIYKRESEFEPVPMIVTLDLTLYDGTLRVPVPAGTRVMVIARHGRNVTFDYEGHRFSVPDGLTRAVAARPEPGDVLR